MVDHFLQVKARGQVVAHHTLALTSMEIDKATTSDCVPGMLQKL